MMSGFLHYTRKVKDAILSFIQSNHCLYDICVGSLEPRITESVRQLGDLLLSIKGGGQVTLNQPSQRNAVAAEADEVLRPLMDLLDGQLLKKLILASCR
jgi:protein unc-13